MEISLDICQPVTPKKCAKKCEHGKIKNQCRECGGSSFCEHGIRKFTCKKCGGTEICVHGKRKPICKECGGSDICIHNKQKQTCKECGGSEICRHNKQKHRCKECGGTSICIHGISKYYCIKCDGNGICIHKKPKHSCKECGGSAICIHGLRKTRCKECGGSGLCKSSWCETQRNKKYEGYCLYCFINLFPDKPVIRNYKTKEKEVVDRIKEVFPDFTWIHDKRVQDGCSKRRPDLLLDLGSHIIIIEIDENKHSEYECTCENKRIMEISQDVYHRPIIFIRFNPDKYIDNNGKTISSCWRLNKNGIICIAKTKINEWNDRIKSLIEAIKYWIDNPSDKLVEQVELFY